MTKTPISPDFDLENYNYPLDPDRIASRPVTPRDSSKMLVFKAKSNQIEHRVFNQLPSVLPDKSQLVLNESEVFPCRVRGVKSTGGAAEVFFLSPLANERGEIIAMVGCSGKKRPGLKISSGELEMTLLEVLGEGQFLVKLEKQGQIIRDYTAFAQMPIPNYIRGGESDGQDLSDYQTLFARNTGSVAAPTAGLHFTEKTFSDLKERSIEIAKVTLHVGLGTFSPVKSQDIREHSMHTEAFEISSKQKDSLSASFGNWIPVGTTALRTLQSCIDESGQFFAPEGKQATDLYLYPGKKVYGIKGLLTNFHMPKSSLMLLVASLIGRENLMNLYQIAIERDYRFYSYGDCMLILLDE